MKAKFFLLTIFLLSILFAKGQDYEYIPFVEEGTRWSYASITMAYEGGSKYKAGYAVYQLKGDTIINGLNYKKLYGGCSEVYQAALREENKKVYIIKVQEEEKCFFDFNLQKGDFMVSGSNNHHYRVTKVDTIQIGESKRKRFVFSSGYETWIEGIGALEGFYPLQGRILSLEGQGINYQKKDSEVVYKTDEWYFNENECDNNGLKFPQSSCLLRILQRNGEIELQTDAGNFESGQVYLYSIQGELMYSIGVKGEANIIIPVSGFSTGTYLIIFQEDKTKKIWKDKVFVNNHIH